MTDTEKAARWIEVVQRVLEYWPHSPWPDHSAIAYGKMLARFDADVILAAVEEFARGGRDHPPTGGMLLQKVLQQALDAPDWGEAWRQLHRSIEIAQGDLVELRRRPCERCEGVRWVAVSEDTMAPCPDCHANVPSLAQLIEERVHPLVWRLVEEVGLSNIRDAGRANTTFEAQCRNKYEELKAAVVRDESLRGIEAPGVRRLERVNRSEPLTVGEVLGELPSG